MAAEEQQQTTEVQGTGFLAECLPSEGALGFLHMAVTAVGVTALR